MGPHHGRFGRHDGIDVEDQVGVIDIEAARSALGLPARLEVEGERRDPPEVLDRFLGLDQLERGRIEPHGRHCLCCEQREAIAVSRRRSGSLEQPMDDDDVGSGELVATGDLRPDVRAVMDEQLQVQLGRKATRVAVTAGRLINASQPAAEGEVRSLDRVEEQRCVGAPVLDPQEGRVALEFRQPERRIQATDNRLKQVAGDRRARAPARSPRDMPCIR